MVFRSRTVQFDVHATRVNRLCPPRLSREPASAAEQIRHYVGPEGAAIAGSSPTVQPTYAADRAPCFP